jgi:hypothetical protein
MRRAAALLALSALIPSGAGRALAQTRSDAPLDPYDSPDVPVDPYASEADADRDDPYASPSAASAARVVAESTTLDPNATLDPYATLAPPAGAASDDERRDVRNSAALFGGLFGLTTSFSLVAGLGDGEVGAGATLAVLGGVAAGAGAGYWIGDSRAPTRAQLHTAVAGYAWGAGLSLLVTRLADSPGVADCATCGERLTANDYLVTSAIGATLGLGAGLWIATLEPGENELAMVSSVGSYGVLGGFLLGLAVHPRDDRGYALTTLLGASAGLATGLWISSGADVPEGRMGFVDLTVAGGAVTPWVVYALAGGDGSDDSALQLTGVASLAMAAIGGGLGWYWSRDPEPSSRATGAHAASAPAALLQRGEGGAWRLSAVVPRPLLLAPAPADPRTRVGLGLDLVSGAF